MNAKKPFVFDVGRDTFDTAVLAASREVPVLTDFWAPWCGPCRMLAPVLDALAERHAGKLLVAKINTDVELELAERWGVRSLPTVKIFRNGEAVDGFVGLLPPAAIQEIVERHIERESDVVLKLAREAMAAGDAERARELLEEASVMDPQNHAVKIALANTHVALGNLDVAQRILDRLPADVQTDAAVKSLRARIELSWAVAQAPSTAVLRDTVAARPDDLTARYQLGVREVLEGHPEEGLEQMFEVMRRNRRFGDDLGRRGLLAAFELLGHDHELVGRYRRKMATIMY
ncbi:MAG TPA: thioredoxin [Gammaproteobacteria bacterium]|nr:thioredoxin [Gammaproteobacteria bacterium]